jgi:hypothetical protein
MFRLPSYLLSGRSSAYFFLDLDCFVLMSLNMIELLLGRLVHIMGSMRRNWMILDIDITIPANRNCEISRHSQ